ncbi:MAG TPA: Smr/MutS family protein [Anaeromyxobacteraceae bacterium]|nr:Smr/MutS family protein [Anaeromyxobacteraceae bacterium]
MARRDGEREPEGPGGGSHPDPDDPAEPVELPIDGTLDLHAFRPSEVGALVPDYLEACAERGIREVRIVHGKGTGALRRTVEAILARDPRVQSFRTAGEGGGGWGATLVTLKG